MLRGLMMYSGAWTERLWQLQESSDRSDIQENKSMRLKLTSLFHNDVEILINYQSVRDPGALH